MENQAGRKTDLIIIGSGLAGTAAACFAVKRGLKIVQVSATGGEMAFAGGPFDLLGVYPLNEQKVWENPWDGIDAVSRDCPKHPYSRLGKDVIREAIDRFTDFVQSAGVPYCGLPDRNVVLPTAAGTLRTSYKVPKSMWRAVAGLEQKTPTLLVDFAGMKDFSAGLMAEMLKAKWPALRSARIDFPLPFPGVDRYNPLLAEAVETSPVREKLAEAIRPYIAGAELVGMPAVLGLRGTDGIVADLESRLEVGIFEIPTMPPSVPGMRLREAVEKELEKTGARMIRGRKVYSARTEARRCTGITAGDDAWAETVEAEGVILATGRFLGGGLVTDRQGISETIFGFPVSQPPTREEWHRDSFLDRRGHPVNEAGLEIDDTFRPLGADGRPAFENVFAAGSILAHQDWVRTKSGAGISIATAFGAVESFLRCRSTVSNG